MQLLRALPLGFFLALVSLSHDAIAAPGRPEPSSTQANDAVSISAVFKQKDSRLEQLERALAGMVNAERAKAGLSPLAYDEELASVARAHSEEMRAGNYFGHVSPTPELRTALERYRVAFNTAPPVVAENLYGAWGGAVRRVCDDDMRCANLALMRSPTHRANILFPNLSRIGIGLVTNADGDIWLTEMFISTKDERK